MHILGFLAIGMIFFSTLVKERHGNIGNPGRHTSITEEAFHERLPVLREITHKGMLLCFVTKFSRGRWGIVRHKCLCIFFMTFIDYMYQYLIGPG